MKCIVIETSTERATAHPVTNEDGTPHIYATISEARTELNANGYSYNRENKRYYINGTEYRAYIVREDSEDYVEIIAAQADELTKPETIEPERIQTVSGNDIYRSIDPVTGNVVFTVSGRDFWELAEARYFAQQNPVTVPAMEADELTKPETIEPEPEPTEPEHSEKAAKDAREYASICAFIAMSCALASVRAWIDGDEHAARHAARAAQTNADRAADAARHANEAAPDSMTARSAREYVAHAQTGADIAARVAIEASRPSAEELKAKYNSEYLIWSE